jgi:hypothetical protein
VQRSLNNTINDSLSEGAPQRHLLHDLQNGRIRLNRAFF